MKADAISLIELFGNKQRLEVPLFQRRYVWEESEQWAPLWDDIALKFADHIEGKVDTPVHFLGAMVLDQKLTPSTYVIKRQIIDGQQRLTTFQIFLAAFADLCAEHDISDLGNEVRKYIENEGMMKDKEVERFKVWPTLQDRIQFASVILAKSPGELETQYPLTKQKWSRTPDPRPRMIESYLFFANELREFFLGDDSIGGHFELRDRLEASFQALKSSLQVVVIDLDTSDDPQVIFETLNARGEPLLPADLLRNYIFLRVGRENEDSENLYEKYWKDFDSDYWRTEVGSGRFRRPRSDIFMQYFLESQTNSDISPKHVYSEYKHWSSGNDSKLEIEEELKVLAQNRGYFERIMGSKVDDSLSEFFRFLSVFEIGTVNPLYLTLLGMKIEPSTLEDISRHIESYLMRRAICGLSTKNYSRTFLRLNQTLATAEPTAKLVAEQLLNLTGIPHIWPSDAQVQEAWRTSPIYTRMNQQRLAYLLKRINDRMYASGTEHLQLDDKPTIEHIMPQAWQQYWPLPDGQQGMTKEELDKAELDDPRALATVHRSGYVDRVGNLTLLTSALNTAQSNSGWEEKAKLLETHSLLPMNIPLRGYDYWDESSVDERAGNLLKIVLDEWRRPTIE